MTEHDQKTLNKTKAVDAGGAPLVVYHGPSKGRDFAVADFRVPAFFTSSREYAEKYVDDDGDPMAFHLVIERPYVIDAAEHELGADAEELAYNDAFRERLLTSGYDGMIVIDGDITDYVVFSAGQIVPCSDPHTTVECQEGIIPKP